MKSHPLLVFSNALWIALREIRRNLTRAVLTVLGIVIGVAAVITMITLGEGATQAVREQVANLGNNLMVLRSGRWFNPGGGAPSYFQLSDVAAIEAQIPGVANAAPVIEEDLNCVWRSNSRQGEIAGSTTRWFEIGKWQLTEGRFYTETEVTDGAAVAVIGQTVLKELFDGGEALGEKFRIGRTTFTVIGVLKGKGQAGFGQDQDDVIAVPLSAMERRLQRRTTTRNINEIIISGRDEVESATLMADITSLMRERRQVAPNEDSDFGLFDTRQIADTMSASTQVLTSLLGAVAGVSLLVGGIGIMNIMLVSVTERTREIGIRMAIGARSGEVLLQFLVEAVCLSSFGGLAGLILAFGLCAWLAPLIQIPFLFNPTINLIAFLFSAGVGVLFGFMPARRAARLDPIEALRHE